MVDGILVNVESDLSHVYFSKNYIIYIYQCLFNYECRHTVIVSDTIYFHQYQNLFKVSRSVHFKVRLFVQYKTANPVFN